MVKTTLMINEKKPLRLSREKAGLNQKTIAKTLGIGVKKYSRIENGLRYNAKIIDKAWEALDTLAPLVKTETSKNNNQRFIKNIVFNEIPEPALKSGVTYLITNIAKYKKDTLPPSICVFIETAKGYGRAKHYIFRHRGGYLESFTATQLIDYSIKEA